MKDSDGEICFKRFELKIFQISLTAVDLSVSHSRVLSCGLSKKCGLWQIWNGSLTLLHQKQNECHLRIVYQAYKDSLQVFLWDTSIQTTHQFQLYLIFFYPCVPTWFIKVTTSLQTCFSSICPSVFAVKNFVYDIIIKV